MRPSAITSSHPQLEPLRAGLEQTTLRERRMLSRALQRLAEAASIDPAALESWQRRLQQAQALHAARVASVPEIRVADDLPIAARADDIVAAIRRHPVLVLAGET